MSKLTFTLNATWITAILLSNFFMQGMENYEQLALQATQYNKSDCPLLDFKFEDELIFACCQIQEVNPKKSPKSSKEALTDTIKNLIKIRTTCKKYYESLTFEKISSFCNDHSCFAKNQTLHDVIFPSTIEQRHRPLILILIYAKAKFQDKQRALLEYSIEHNDACMLKTLLMHQVNLNKKAEQGGPLIFDAKTVEIAQIFIDNGVDIYASRHSGYNVLSDLLRSNVKYSERLGVCEVYYNDNGYEITSQEVITDHEYMCPTKQSTWDLIHFYLKNKVTMSDEDLKLFHEFTSQLRDKENTNNDDSSKDEPMQQKEPVQTSEPKKDTQSCIIF